MPVPAQGEFVATVVKASNNGTTKHYLTVFMCFGRLGSTATLTHLTPAADGTPRFSLTYQCGGGALGWLPWSGMSESEAPVNSKIQVNGTPIVVEEPPDGVIAC